MYVYVCMYACTCMYLFIYVCIYLCVRLYVCVYIMYVCIYIYVFILKYIYIYLCILFIDETYLWFCPETEKEGIEWLKKQPGFAGESKENVVRNESKESEDVLPQLVPKPSSSSAKGDLLC
jgi:hypothetical protein